MRNRGLAVAFVAAAVTPWSASPADAQETSISFQPPGYAPPAGYVADEGAAFSASRGYGWLTATGYDAKDAPADVRLNTYAYVWEYAFPNGDYLVTLVAGSPANRSLSTVQLEGSLVLDRVATSGSFAEVTDFAAAVADGRLTMTLGGTGADRKTKVCYLLIRPAGALPPAPEPGPDPVPPTAGASATPTAGVAPLVVAFAGSGPDSDGTIASCAWDFADGSGSTQQGPAHTFASAGTYIVALTVTDDSGLTATDSVRIDVTAPVPGGDPFVFALPREGASITAPARRARGRSTRSSGPPP